MKKEDLQDFDIVITRENKSYFVYRDYIIPIGNSVIYSLDITMYDDGLLRRDKIEVHDIMKVLRYNSEVQVYNLSCFMTDFLSLNFPTFYKTVYERKEFTEVTMDEIAEKFGVPVEQLKIKK